MRHRAAARARLSGTADAVIGSRFLRAGSRNGQAHQPVRAGRTALGFLTRRPVTDPTSGFCYSDLAPFRSWRAITRGVKRPRARIVPELQCGQGCGSANPDAAATLGANVIDGFAGGDGGRPHGPWRLSRSFRGIVEGKQVTDRSSSSRRGERHPAGSGRRTCAAPTLTEQYLVHLYRLCRGAARVVALAQHIPARGGGPRCSLPTRLTPPRAHALRCRRVAVFFGRGLASAEAVQRLVEEMALLHVDVREMRESLKRF